MKEGKIHSDTHLRLYPLGSLKICPPRGKVTIAAAFLARFPAPSELNRGSLSDLARLVDHARRAALDTPVYPSYAYSTKSIK